MRYILQRRSLGPIATEGKMVIDGKNLYTLEPALGAAQPGEPVPAGDYRLVPHDSAKYGRIWAMVNPALGVYHQPDDRPNGVGRFACLWAHSGNYDQHSLGCVLVGLAAGLARDPDSGRIEPAVFNSKAAVALLQQLVPWVEHELTIKNPN
jgi:hypothetical protein